MPKKQYPLLHTINSPDDLRLVPRAQLRELTDELRAFLLHSVGSPGTELEFAL